MSRLFRIIRVTACVCSAVCATAMAHAGEHPAIRVAMYSGPSAITVRAVRGMLTLAAGDGSRTLNTRQATLRAVKGSVRVNGQPFAGDHLVVDAQPALFRIDRRTFRGRLHAYARAGGELLIVDELDLEDYLAGLINSEISSNWPLEAVKAQAIAARTYALNQIGGTTKHRPHARYDVESSVLDQVYHGAHREDKRAYAGVRATTGMVLTRGGLIFPSFYHSTCGGYTEHARNVWPGAKGAPPTTDRFCRRSPHGTWFLRIPRERFIATLTGAGILTSTQLMLDVAARPFADSPRVNEVIIATDTGDARVKATKLRRLLGYKRLKSTWFNVGIEGNEVVFAGRGFGHGVGLCQWGAKGMAEAGHTYKEILAHYYSDAEIGRMY